MTERTRRSDGPEQERSGADEQNLGTELDHAGSVDAALATVERPVSVEEGATVDVTGYDYDDERGRVEVRVDVGDETVALALAPDEATALADRLATAAAAAERDQ
jgi:hypothetical protein